MAFILVVAMDKNGCIGKNGRLPWGEKSIPADMAHFRSITLGEVVVMGRHTCDSLNLGYLKDRFNVVLTRNRFLVFNPEVLVFHEPDSIRDCAKMLQILGMDIYIIGGGELYSEFLPDATKMYVTRVDGDFGGDVYFPKYNPDEWFVTRSKKIAKGLTTPYDLEFVTLDRKR